MKEPRFTFEARVFVGEFAVGEVTWRPVRCVADAEALTRSSRDAGIFVGGKHHRWVNASTDARKAIFHSAWRVVDVPCAQGSCCERAVTIDPAGEFACVNHAPVSDPSASAQAIEADGLVIEVLSVTPELATQWLESRARNRSISDSTVNRYAADMKAGTWRLTHQGIAFDADGVLVDGEHRLWAVTRSGVAVRMMVTRGLCAEDREAFDQGRSRSVADALHLAGADDVPRAAVSWFRVLANLQNPSRHNIQVSAAYVRAQTERYRDTVAWMATHGPRKRPLNRVAVVAAMVYAHAVKPREVEAFVTRYLKGTELVEGEPVLTLRRYVMERLTGTRESERETALKSLRALAAHVQGETLPTLRDSALGFEFFQKLHTEVR